jgi:ATPase family associated with various cellular activities (AAA)
MQFNELIKTQMMLQMPSTKNPLLNMLALNGFEIAVKTFPTWSAWASALCCRRRKPGQSVEVPQSAMKTPRASITCERGTTTQTNANRTTPATIYSSRMDAVVFFVTTLPAMKSLLGVTNHDYLPNEFEPVCLDNDVYFELMDLKVTDGAPEVIKFKLYCYEHDVQHLQTFVDTCNTDYERRMANKLGAHRYYFDQMVQTKTKGSIQNPLPSTHLVYTKTKFVTTRTFENVFFDQRKQVRDRVKFFLEHRDWYEKKGIPYTLGFMFHGPPGTGKTSSIKAIANAGRRHIINIQLSEIKTKQQLQHLFFNDEIHVFNGANTEKYIIPVAERLYVIEDIDAMGDVVLRREWKKPVVEEKKKEDDMFDRKEEKDTFDLSFLLNLLDGTLEANGRIIAFSSNYPERIDKALIRPGRVDMIVHFKNCTRAVLKEMVDSFYEQDITIPDDPTLDGKWSPAEAVRILFQNFGDPEAAVAELVSLNPKGLYGIEDSTNLPEIV